MAKTTNQKITMDDTGERMVPEFNKGTIVYGEHMARYHSLEKIVKDKIVLDIASGSGYGTELIARTAKKVFGVDVSEEAINYSKKNYNAKNIDYRVGNGTSIPLDDKSTDVVVSFETIEHIENYKQFMSEIKRVLKPNGVLILSTPNDDEYSEENHFHIHEFRLKELQHLASEFYKHHEMYYQIDALYSALLPKKLMNGKEWEASINTYQYVPLKEDKAIYFLVVCSDLPIQENINGIGVISEHWSELKNHDKDMIFKKHMDDQSIIIKHLEREIKNITEKLSAELIATRSELENIKGKLPVKIALESVRVTRSVKNKFKG